MTNGLYQRPELEGEERVGGSGGIDGEWPGVV